MFKKLMSLLSKFFQGFGKKKEEKIVKTVKTETKKNEKVMEPVNKEELIEDALVPEVEPIKIEEDDNTILGGPAVLSMEEIKEDRKKAENNIHEYAKLMKNGKVRKITEIAVHCTASKEGVDLTIKKIDDSHKARGFKKQAKSGMYCGYHFVIALNGTIMFGRDLSEVGAHVSGHNSNSIGISYVGGLDKNGKGKDTRTEAQKETLIWLITTLKKVLEIKKVQGHRDYSPDKNGDGKITKNEWIKECPCFDAIPEYEKL